MRGVNVHSAPIIVDIIKPLNSIGRARSKKLNKKKLGSAGMLLVRFKKMVGLSVAVAVAVVAAVAPTPTLGEVFSLDIAGECTQANLVCAQGRVHGQSLTIFH